MTLPAGATASAAPETVEVVASGGINASDGLFRALDHLKNIQWERGCWVGEVVWCTMLLSQYIIVSHMTGQPIDPVKKEKYLKYYRAWQTPDGGFGMHRESPAYVFMTALAYVALRMLGLGPDEELPRRAREWLSAHGGITHIPSWGKFWLAMLNLYGWEGVNPIQPELWILPEWAPMHPRRMYNHTRLIYLGIGYLYGRRLTIPVTPLIEALRTELYAEPYASIDFARYRHALAPTDVYAAPSAALRAAYDALSLYEAHHSKKLRNQALDVCFDRILFELRSTRYACVSPVNGLLNILALWDRRHPEFLAAYRGVDYWIWEDDEEGIRYNGAHSHTWDTAFTAQAILDGPPAAIAHMQGPLSAANRYFDEAQMRTEIDDREHYYRDRRKGGFCFSDQHHQWPVSDCTAESLSALIEMERHLPVEKRFSPSRLADAAEFILSRQNADGGWGSYERNRGSLLLELLNPSEMFGNCMVELSYVECTASCVAGLSRFRNRYPTVLRDPVDSAISQGIAYLRKKQLPDGSWEGFWGVNFTYAIMYCTDGLIAAGIPADDPALKRARNWLVNKQRADGGWGEHYTSCEKRKYVPHKDAQVIMTSWAVMALLAGPRSPSEVAPEEWAAAERGISLLLSRQHDNGDFPKEGVGGVFFNTAMHHYCLYKNYFSVWALSRYERLRTATR